LVEAPKPPKTGAELPKPPKAGLPDVGDFELKVVLDLAPKAGVPNVDEPNAVVLLLPKLLLFAEAGLPTVFEAEKPISRLKCKIFVCLITEIS
jgi:hypothetical protein